MTDWNEYESSIREEYAAHPRNKKYPLMFKAVLRRLDEDIAKCSLAEVISVINRAEALLDKLRMEFKHGA